MSVDIRQPQPPHQRDCSWVRRFGSHEDAGWSISLGRQSAHISEPDVDVTWIADREDIPAAWSAEIDLSQLQAELRSAICSRLTPSALEELIRAVKSQVQSARWAERREVQAEIRHALGIDA